MPMSRDKVRKNIGRISKLKGKRLETAVDKFMARQRSRSRKRKR